MAVQLLSWQTQTAEVLVFGGYEPRHRRAMAVKASWHIEASIVLPTYGASGPALQLS